MRDGLPAGLRAALEALNARRPDLWLDVRWSRSLLSTMDAAVSAAESGLPAGHIVLADEQTAGRGRRGRTWCSPPGAGLYFSYVTRPTRDIELLTIAAGVGVVEGVARATGVHAHLKWPNDLLVGHRKLAGVLAEGAHLGTPRAAGDRRRRPQPRAGRVSARRRGTCDRFSSRRGAPVCRGSRSSPPCSSTSRRPSPRWRPAGRVIFCRSGGQRHRRPAARRCGGWRTMSGTAG